MPFPRSSGVLLHPTSLPSRFGIGDLGSGAKQFIDFLHSSLQQYWQVLPLGPTGFGNSPYMCYSAMAGNPLLISPEKLVTDGLLSKDNLHDIPDFSPYRVDYDRVIEFKANLFKNACKNFISGATAEQKADFEEFCHSKAYWLDDFALFMALKDAHGGDSWYAWSPELMQREPTALSRAQSELAETIFYHKFIQYQFFHQWLEIKTYANKKGIDIIGDIPIYVAHDSADVWANPDYFYLDEETGEPTQMAGVPPDYFSETGQLWGNPIYHWERLQKQGFKWWIQRFEAMLDYVDIIRIDHFRGFEAFWSVPQGEETAINGKWVKAPGEELFKAIRQKLGKLPVLAEDLGVITPDVEALRDEFEFPGMKVLQFAFGSDPGNPFLPFNFPRNCVVYTGTHDNDTTLSWFNNLNDWERRNLLLYLGGSISQDGIHWDLIRLALSSVANQAIIPLQDVLGYGGDTRMNFPGTDTGNWEWRYHEDAIHQSLSEKLRDLTVLFGRAPLSKG